MIRIFIVDDEELILKALTRTLRRPGVAVTAFLRAEEAMAHLPEAPDLLICDYHMPRFDGLSVVAEARRVSPATRTMLLSGGVQDVPVTDALSAAMVDFFVAKPWHMDELLGVVEALMP